MAMMRSIPVRFGMSMPVVVEVEEAAPQQSGTMGREGEGMMGREGGRMMGHEGKRMMDREGERMMGREGERMNMMMGMDPETRMQHMRMMERPGELGEPPSMILNHCGILLGSQCMHPSLGEVQRRSRDLLRNRLHLHPDTCQIQSHTVNTMLILRLLEK